MMQLPPVTPLTIPVDASTVATPVLLLLHVPPLVASLSFTVLPAHTDVPPVTGATGFTDTVVVIEHPPGMV